MTPHYQNKFGVEGNCWQTAVASLLDLPTEEVPDFVNIDDAGGENWLLHTRRFLKERGMVLELIPGHLDTDEYYLVTGHSPRFPAMYHVVIYRNGRMVHDPHPSQDGLVDEVEFEIIRKG